MTTYHWTTNTETPVAVDGVFGSETVRAVQFGLGVETTGVEGPYTTSHFETFLGVPVTAGDVLSEGAVKALQTRLGGLTVDGDMGPLTVTALQNALNAGTLGAVTPVPSTGVLDPIAVSDVQYDHYAGIGDPASWIAQGMVCAGVSGSDWNSGLVIIEENESSGNPNAINDYDLNAHGATQSDGYPQDCSRGLMQCIPPTFAAYHVSETPNEIYNPVANVAAAIHYIIATYGSIDNVPGIVSLRNGGSYQGY